jgi:hypothetical protein
MGIKLTTLGTIHDTGISLLSPTVSIAVLY